MDSKTEVLKKSVLFSTLQPQDLREIADYCETRDIQEGELLAATGNKASFFFILVSGTLLLAMENDKSIFLDKPGDFIGMDILSSHGRYHSTLTALTKGEILVIRRDDFLDIIQSDSEAANIIMTSWSRHLEENITFLEKSEDSGIDYQY